MVIDLYFVCGYICKVLGAHTHLWSAFYPIFERETKRHLKTSKSVQRNWGFTCTCNFYYQTVMLALNRLICQLTKMLILQSKQKISQIPKNVAEQVCVSSTWCAWCMWAVECFKYLMWCIWAVGDALYADNLSLWIFNGVFWKNDPYTYTVNVKYGRVF